MSSLEWRGNQALSRSELQAVTFTQGPSWKVWQADPTFSEATLIGDMERLEALYRTHGRYEARASYSLAWDDTATRVAVTIDIVEGPAIELTGLQIALAHDDPGLTADLPLVIGQPFSPRLYAQSKDVLLDRLAEAGHPNAQIEGGATVDVPTREAVVEWNVDPGPVVYFGDIVVEGLYQVKQKTVKREIPIRPGERYSTSRLVHTRRTIQKQGLWAWVNVLAQPSAQRPAPERPPAFALSEEEREELAGQPDTVIWPVTVRVTERSPYTVDAGIGYSTDESFRASAGWRNGNFLGDARTLRLTGVYSGILGKAQAEFTQPYLLNTQLSLITTAAYRYENEPAFEANRLITTVGVARPIRLPWVARLTYRYRLQDVERKSLIPLDEAEGRSNVGTLEFGLRRQTLDDLLNPTRGTWLDLVVAPSLKELGSDFDFVTFVGEARGFVPLPLRSVLAGRIRIGAIQPIRGTVAPQIPLVERFYTGGSTTHRGFRYHELPPNGGVFFKEGGASRLEGNLEWRFPVWGNLGAVVFVDAALLDVRPWRYPLDNLFWAVGPGLRYDTFVGPLRFDWGTLINRASPRQSRFQWYISVGHSF